MSILEERKAFEEGFDRLQRIYKEWQRNPSALVRDSLKKYLIDCYDHLLKLDRIDIDAGKFEDSIISDIRHSENEIDEHIEQVKEEILVEEIAEVENEIEDEVEELAPIIALDETEEIIEMDEAEEVVAQDETEEEEIEEEAEEIVAEQELDIVDEEKETPEVKELDPSEVYLSGSEELEIEEFFKNNFPQSEIAETKTVETDAENIQENEEIKEEVVAEELQEETIEEIVETPISEEKELKVEEIEVEAKTEEIEDDSKSRWSSFFGKDEPKPFDDAKNSDAQQLTLADKLATKEDVGVHYEMKEQAITDLNAAVPIAKKFEFIRELFGDDSTNYKTAVSSINEAGELQKALDISENLAETYNWSSKEKLAEEFNTFVKRRFSEA